ncbi:formate/nitrite transporter family protein [Bacillus sp. T33-2]|uniref:formate/nitrite transporter family protein n=1 Tax=Bacillus sp. T33-2 TaxID=2054168 RepID=UPI000C783D00|nr:formate/nitrite transporter family protein [Bacillus sp. T33-2]PLR99238.1 formate/nitrite transporter [Bacillus sp. T33-2]
MSYHTPQKIAELSIESGFRKAKMSIPTMLILGFLAGAFIAMGFLLYVRLTGNMPKDWGSFTTFLGAAVFPIGIVLVLLAGGELLTGNMMTLPMAWFAKKITFTEIVRNWFYILISNFIGAVFVAYFFGHVVGLTETGPYLNQTVTIAQAKLNDTFMQAFISAIGCNWLVALAIWIATGSQDYAGKIMGVWFPIMAFIVIGFQHVVANMFIIPAAIFAGEVTWMEYTPNFVAVLLGNIVGGSIFVGLAYFTVYNSHLHRHVVAKQKHPEKRIINL